MGRTSLLGHEAGERNEVAECVCHQQLLGGFLQKIVNEFIVLSAFGEEQEIDRCATSSSSATGE